MKTLADLHILVLGLGESGLAMVRWCASQGAKVTVVDTREKPPCLATMHLENIDATFVHGSFVAALLDDASIRGVFKSPGLSPAQVEPVWTAAQQKGLWQGTELSLFAHAMDCLAKELAYQPYVVAITGTNGKTTVTAAEERANRLALRTRRKDKAEGVMLKALADQRDDEAFFLAKYDKFNPTKFQMDIVKKYRKIVLDKYSDPNNQCIVPIENLPLLKVDQLKALAARLNDSEEEDPVYVAAVTAQLDKSDVENAPFVAPRTFPLSPIQNFITEYVSPEMKTKGLLMWHSAGSGKTCGAVSMASKNFAARGYSVVWVTRTNMIGDVAKNVFGTGPMDMICDFGNRDRIEKFRKIYNADGEIAGTERHRNQASGTLDNLLDPGETDRGLYQDVKLERALSRPFAVECVEGLLDESQFVERTDLGHHEPIELGTVSSQFDEVTKTPFGVHGVDSHQQALSVPIQGADSVPGGLPGRDLLIGKHRVLKVEEQGVNTAFRALLKESRPVGRNRQEAPHSVQVGARGVSRHVTA